MDQSANDWHTRSPPFSFVPVQHYVAAYNHGHHPESMPAFALLLNVHSKPTTWAPHTIPRCPMDVRTHAAVPMQMHADYGVAHKCAANVGSKNKYARSDC